MDESPFLSAEYMVDKHIIKMILETCQILSTTHRICDGKNSILQKEKRKSKIWTLPDFREEILYKATHINHPSCVWARTSVENYNWLVDHLFALNMEYMYRYNKSHSSYNKLFLTLQTPPLNLKDWDWTTPPCAMPKEYIISDNYIENYREYYRKGKKKLHSWKKREKPKWIKE